MTDENAEIVRVVHDSAAAKKRLVCLEAQAERLTKNLFELAAILRAPELLTSARIDGPQLLLEHMNSGEHGIELLTPGETAELLEGLISTRTNLRALMKRRRELGIDNAAD